VDQAGGAIARDNNRVQLSIRSLGQRTKRMVADKRTVASCVVRRAS
jgi:hypothetical protein